jgi:hypothetical protein
MNRKGVSLEAVLVTVAVFVVVAVVMIFVYKKLFDVGREEFTEAQCQASLDLTRKFELSPVCIVTAPNPVAIHCGRDFITIEDEKVVKNGDDATKRYDAACPDKPVFESKDRESMGCVAENVIAESMRQCWQQFYEGEVPVFQQYEYDKASMTNLAKSLGGEKEIRGCFVCAEIDVKKTGGVSHYGQYLRTAEFRKGKEMITYFDYFTSKKAYCDPELITRASGTDSCFEAIAFNQEKDGVQWSVAWGWPPVRREYVADAPLDEWRLAPGKYAVTFVRRGMMTCDSQDAEEGQNTPLTLTVQLVPAERVPQFCNMVFV